MSPIWRATRCARRGICSAAFSVAPPVRLTTFSAWSAAPRTTRLCVAPSKRSARCLINASVAASGFARSLLERRPRPMRALFAQNGSRNHRHRIRSDHRTTARQSPQPDRYDGRRQSSIGGGAPRLPVVRRESGGGQKVLRRMRRQHDVQVALLSVQRLRRARPEILQRLRRADELRAI